MPLRKRKFSVKEKLAAASLADQTSITNASNKLGIDRKNIRDWLNKKRAGKYDNVSLKAFKLPGGGRRVGNAAIDDSLHEWLMSQRQKGFRITGKMLQREAHQRFILSGNLSFKASKGWLQKWMSRHSISVRPKTSVAQKLPRDLDD